MNHFDHTYNGGASSKIPQSKEQFMLSQLGYDEQIYSKKWDGSSQKQWQN
jgi:hypothetical protein